VINTSFYIAKRYLWSKGKRNIVTLISRISLFGVMIITAALVVLLSAFNGIEKMIEQLYSEFDPPITIQHIQRKTFFDNELDLRKLQKIPGVKSVSKEIEEIVVLRHEQKWINARLYGVEKSFLSECHLQKHLINHIGANAYQDGRFAYIGADLMQNLRLSLGTIEKDEVLLYAPKRNVKIRLGKAPFFSSRIPIDGAVNFNKEVNNSALLWDFQSASDLLGYQNEISKIYVSVSPGFSNVEVKNKIIESIGSKNFSIKTNLEKNELIFKTSKSERLVVFIILLFVFVLAAFNLVASLTMLYVEKKESIKLLTAIGMTRNDIFNVFFFEGLLISSLGILFGLALGYLVCFIQIKTAFLIIPGANVPFPIVFTLSDLGLILGAVSALSFLFSFFPVRILVKNA
jgi:lipoprotein-releasing system permease protein